MQKTLPRKFSAILLPSSYRQVLIVRFGIAGLMSHHLLPPSPDCEDSAAIFRFCSK